MEWFRTWFSNLSVHSNHQESMLEHIPGSIPLALTPEGRSGVGDVFHS